MAKKGILYLRMYLYFIINNKPFRPLCDTVYHETFMAGNFRGSMASYYFVIKHLRLLMMDLRIMPVMEIIKHKTFAVVQKTAKSAKVSCHKSFMVYGNTYCFWKWLLLSIFILKQINHVRHTSHHSKHDWSDSSLIRKKDVKT